MTNNDTPTQTTITAMTTSRASKKKEAEKKPLLILLLWCICSTHIYITTTRINIYREIYKPMVSGLTNWTVVPLKLPPYVLTMIKASKTDVELISFKTAILFVRSPFTTEKSVGKCHYMTYTVKANQSKMLNIYYSPTFNISLFIPVKYLVAVDDSISFG